MLRFVMAQIPVPQPPKEDPCRSEQPGPFDLTGQRPARRVIGDDEPALPRRQREPAMAAAQTMKLLPTAGISALSNTSGA